MNRLAAPILALAALAAFAPDVHAAAPLPWAATTVIGSIPGYDTFGGFVLKYDNPNVMLFRDRVGSILQIPITRNSGFHITGFAGPATFYASAPDTNSVGQFLAYGPNNVLLYTSASDTIGQIKPGSTSPDRFATPSGLSSGTTGSLSDFALNPYTPGKGILSKRVDPANGSVYSTTLIPDGNGTFDFQATIYNSIVSATSVDYVPNNISYLPSQQVWVSRNNSGYGNWATDAAGELVGSYGTYAAPATCAIFDPLTGDYVYQTLGTVNNLNVVNTIPEPAGLISAGALAALTLLRRRR